MASQWFYKIGGQQIGPVSFQDLVEMVRLGTLTEDHRVRREMSEQWIAARDVIGLFREAGKRPASTEPAEEETQSLPSTQVSPPTQISPPQATAPVVAAASPSHPARKIPWAILVGAVLALVVVAEGYRFWTARPEPPPLPVNPSSPEAEAANRKKFDEILQQFRAGKTGRIDLAAAPFQVDAVLPQLADLKEIGYLSLDNCGITEVGMENLGKLTNLRQLSLTKTRFTDDGLKHLAKLPNLEMLRLDQCAITDKGLANLRGMASLKNLSLYRTRVTDAGVVHLTTLPNLRRVSLDETQVSDAGIGQLKGMTQLKILNVWNTRVTPEGWKRLQEARPDLAITH